LLTWGTADERVKYRLTVKLHEFLPNVDAIGYPGLTHDTTPAQLDRIVAWLAKLNAGRLGSRLPLPLQWRGGTSKSRFPVLGVQIPSALAFERCLFASHFLYVEKEHIRCYGG
jgi:hypothetical protein